MVHRFKTKSIQYRSLKMVDQNQAMHRSSALYRPKSSRPEHLIKNRGKVLTAGRKSFNSFIVAYIEVLVVVHAVV